jgi:hypothetical protein
MRELFTIIAHIWIVYFENGVFCPTPQKGILRGLEREVVRDGSLCQGLNDRRDVNDLGCLGELVPPTQIDMLPGHGRHLCEQIFLWLGWPVRPYIRTSDHSPK